MLRRVGTRLGMGRRVEGGGPEESRGVTAAKAEVGARLNKTCATGQSRSQAAAARGDPCAPPAPTRGWQAQGSGGWLCSGGTTR